MINCPKCNEENPPKFRLCGYCGTPLAPAAAPLPVHEVRRTVTIVFCDLKGSTSLGENLDPEALHEVKDRYFSAMAAEITRHGGKIEKYIGDAIMAVFGLPLPHEDDALRAVRAAAGMQAALGKVNADLGARYGVSLANRTGVNTGEVVANDDPTADQKLVTGDAVNVTARLEQAAPENQIYLGETTYRLVRDAVEVEAVEPLELKGKQERVAAFRLVSARGLDGYARRGDSPMVGREEELAAVDEALREAAVSRQARLVTIIGDAGMGKSRLAREVIARASGHARIVRGRCLPYGDGITFWPLRDIAGEAADIRFDDNPEEAIAKLTGLVGDADVAARLAAAIGLTTAAFPLHEINWAARKFLETLAADRLLVALIDDIHWAEKAFLDLIENILDTAENAPILLLATTRHDLLEKRPEWGERPSALRLVLRPLTDEWAARVAENLLGSTGLPADVTRRIVEAAEGNPLYLEQILSMLIDTKALRKEEGRWVRGEGYGEISIPPTIKALLEARLGQLGREERTAIEPASVIGLQFAAPAVASLAPTQVRADIERHLKSLTRKQFVHPAPSADAEPIYRFHHHLVRDTVYGGLLKRARAGLHIDFVKWADQINAERGRGLEFEEILGYHLEQAYRYLAELGPLDEKGHAIGKDGARRLTSAARRSFIRGDIHAARSLFRRANALLKKEDPERLAMLPELSETLMQLGEFVDARLLLDEALNGALQIDDDRLAANVRLTRMFVRLYSGEDGDWGAEAISTAEAVIPILEKHNASGELATAWRLVSFVHGVGGRYSQAVEAAKHVVTHAREAGNVRLVARSGMGFAIGALLGPTPVPEVIRECERIIAGGLTDRQVESVILCVLAQLRAMRGEFDDARDLYRRGRSMLHELGQGVSAAATGIDLARVELLAGGDLAAAEKDVREDYEFLSMKGETYLLPSMAAVLARIVREGGRDAEALALTVIAEQAAGADDVDAQVQWRSIRAPILARGGDLAGAESMAKSALALAQSSEAPILLAETLCELADVLTLAGRPQEAEDRLTEALSLYTSKGDVVSTARIKARLGHQPHRHGMKPN